VLTSGGKEYNFIEYVLINLKLNTGDETLDVFAELLTTDDPLRVHT